MRQGPRRLRVVVVVGENLGGLFRTQKHEYTRSSWGTLPWESVKFSYFGMARNASKSVISVGKYYIEKI